jgi:methionine-rich copper-binding protein CopC
MDRFIGVVAWLVGVAAVVLTVFFLALPAAPVAAHTALEASSPKAGGKIGVAPAQLVLKFTEPIMNTGSRVEVQDPDGRTYQAGPARIAGDQLTQSLAPLGPAGQYQVRIRVVAADGHPLITGMRFTLTKPGPAAGGAKADDRPIALAPVYSTSGSVNNAPTWAPWLGGAFAVVLMSGAVLFGRRATRGLD